MREMDSFNQEDAKRKTSMNTDAVATGLVINIVYDLIYVYGLSIRKSLERINMSGAWKILNDNQLTLKLLEHNNYDLLLEDLTKDIIKKGKFNPNKNDYNLQSVTVVRYLMDAFGCSRERATTLWMLSTIRQCLQEERINIFPISGGQCYNELIQELIITGKIQGSEIYGV